MQPLYENLITLHDFDQRLYLSTLKIFGTLRSLYSTFLSPAIVQTCKELGVVLPFLHTQPIFHLLSQKLKITGGYFGFDAHQDWSGLQTSLNSLVVWLPFHTINSSCFPLEIIPGSHVQGLCPGREVNNDYKIDEQYLAANPFERVNIAEGDAVIMSPFLVHRTGLSETDRLRIAASWKFEDALEPTFIARNLPFAQSRHVSHHLVTPDFPSPAEMDAALASIRSCAAQTTAKRPSLHDDSLSSPDGRLADGAGTDVRPPAPDGGGLTL